MPSDTETLGFVVMEALASGVPVVGVAAGGLIDIIDNNVDDNQNSSSCNGKSNTYKGSNDSSIHKE